MRLYNRNRERLRRRAEHRRHDPDAEAVTSNAIVDCGWGRGSDDRLAAV